MILPYLRGNRGFTLIELLVALAVLGLVMMGIFAFYSYGIRTFSRGRDRAQMQQNLRAAAEMITREVRYATEMERLSGYDVLPAGSSDVAAGDHYIYLDEETGAIMLMNSEYSAPVTEGLFTGLVFSNHGRVFKFTIQSGTDENAVVFETGLLLANTAYIQSYESSISAIRYRKPD